MLDFNICFYSVGESSYMFVVLSDGISKLGEAFTLAISTLIKFGNLLSMFLNLSFLLHLVDLSHTISCTFNFINKF